MIIITLVYPLIALPNLSPPYRRQNGAPFRYTPNFFTTRPPPPPSFPGAGAGIATLYLIIHPIAPFIQPLDALLPLCRLPFLPDLLLYARLLYSLIERSVPFICLFLSSGSPTFSSPACGPCFCYDLYETDTKRWLDLGMFYRRNEECVSSISPCLRNCRPMPMARSWAVRRCNVVVIVTLGSRKVRTTAVWACTCMLFHDWLGEYEYKAQKTLLCLCVEAGMT